jgi:hypothetical protein
LRVGWLHWGMVLRLGLGLGLRWSPRWVMRLASGLGLSWGM